jgi:hypothetical protein
MKLNKDEKQFVDSILNNRVILSLGTKGSGKTYLMLNFLKYCLQNKIYEAYVLVFPAYGFEQKDSYGFLKEIEKEPYIYIFEGYDEYISAQLLEKQENVKKREKTLYVIDDSSGEQVWNIDPYLKKIITVVRHLDISLWMLCHATSKILAPFLRANTDILLLSRITSYKLLENLYDEFVSLIEQYMGNDGRKRFYNDIIQMHKEKEYQVLYLDLREDIINFNAGQFSFNKK